MSDPFDWQIGEEDDELPPFEERAEASRGYWIWPLTILLATAVAVNGITCDSQLSSEFANAACSTATSRT